MSKSPTKMLTIMELKQRLKELSQEEVVDLSLETLSSHKGEACIAAYVTGTFADPSLNDNFRSIGARDLILLS